MRGLSWLTTATMLMAATQLATPGTAMGDDALAKAGLFKLRCASPGVLRCIGFDHPGDIPYLNGGIGNQGIFIGGVKSLDDPALRKQNRALPALDPDVKASGRASLKFTVRPRSGASASGTFVTTIAEDPQFQLDEGDEIYVQWRQRFHPVLLDKSLDVGRVWKQFILAEGDEYDDSGNVVKYHWSCEQLEVVVQHYQNYGFPIMYHGCGQKDGRYDSIMLEGLKTKWSMNDIDYQPGTGCFYNWISKERKKGRTNFEKAPGDDVGCIVYKPDQWMTFQVRVKVGTWYKNDKNYNRDSVVQLWIAEQGKPSDLVVNHSAYDLANTATPPVKYGKVWLLPYHTRKNASEDHPITYTWYDELIISTSRIPDPIY